MKSEAVVFHLGIIWLDVNEALQLTDSFANTLVCLHAESEAANML